MARLAVSMFQLYIQIKLSDMSKIFLFGSASFMIAWLVAFLLFHVNPMIHILLFLTVITFLIGLLYNKAFMH